MSSDESDYEEIQTNPSAVMRPPQYRVMRPQWRSNILSDWLETFDFVYDILRRESLGRRGAYARRRVHDSTTTYSQSRSFVACLPINAYDESWLSGRKDIPFSITPTDVYNFGHSPEVIRYGKCSVLLNSLLTDLSQLHSWYPSIRITNLQVDYSTVATF